jgi:hypothetical protein
MIATGSPVGANYKSLNWSGYVVATSFTGPAATVTQVIGSWVVQAVTPTASATYSSQWIGIGGFFSGDGSLIQVGTESDYAGGASYYAWYELLPAAETPISMTVKPGDVIYANVSLAAHTTDTWVISLYDQTSHGSFAKFVTYTSSKLSAEWIDERPELCSATCTLTSLANFGKAHYGFDYTGQANTNFAVIKGVLGKIASFPHASIAMVDKKGLSLATPTALSRDGTSFSMKWHLSS